MLSLFLQCNEHAANTLSAACRSDCLGSRRFCCIRGLGRLLAARWRRLVWIHLLAAFWAAIVEFFGWVCPLTPLENWLRRRGGQGGYPSDFIAHYVLPILYPEGLTREVQITLGVIVVLINSVIYGSILRSKRRTID